MFCENCGKSIGTATYCANCGARQTAKTTQTAGNGAAAQAAVDKSAGFKAKWTIKILNTRFYKAKAVKILSIIFGLFSYVGWIISFASVDSGGTSPLFVMGIIMIALNLYLHLPVMLCVFADVARRSYERGGILYLLLGVMAAGTAFMLLMFYPMFLLVRMSKENLSSVQEQQINNNITYRIVKMERAFRVITFIYLIFLTFCTIAILQGARNWGEQFSDANNYEWVRVDFYGNQIS